MTLERFYSLIEAYGADPHRWPEDERAAMQAFAEAHPAETEQALAQARALDALLDAAAPAAPSDLLQARILAAAPRPAAAQNWRAGVAAAAALVLGMAGGYGAGAVAPAMPEAELYADAFEGLDPDWSPWAEFET